MKSFKIGETVVTDQDGPLMTVNQDSNENGIVRCVWFEGANLKTSEFAADSLNRVIYFKVDDDVPVDEARQAFVNYLQNRNNKVVYDPVRGDRIPFRRGSLVRLGNDGERMTFDGIENGMARCIWFDTSLSTNLHSELFPLDQLQPAPLCDIDSW